MTKDEFDNLSSDGKYPCPVCGSTKTEPYPGCGCPRSETGYGTRHINKYHHDCRYVERYDKAVAEYRLATEHITKEKHDRP